MWFVTLFVMLFTTLLLPLMAMCALSINLFMDLTSSSSLTCISCVSRFIRSVSLLYPLGLLL
jgi:hypothetical protein